MGEWDQTLIKLMIYVINDKQILKDLGNIPCELD